MSAWLRLLGASVHMVVRSRDTLLAALVTPLALVALLALWRQLDFVTDAGAIDFFSFVATGFVSYGVVGLAQHSMVGAAADYRVLGVLKRMAVTPISPAAFISAHAVARVGVAVAQVAITMALATWLGAQIQVGPNLAWLVPITVLTALIGLAIAFVVAGVTNGPDAANNLDLMLLLPVYFLAGIMWPTQGLPEPVEQLARYAIPFTGLVEALRGIALEGASITDFGRQLTVAGAWLVALFLLAVRTYRLTEE